LSPSAQLNAAHAGHRPVGDDKCRSEPLSRSQASHSIYRNRDGWAQRQIIKEIDGTWWVGWSSSANHQDAPDEAVYFGAEIRLLG
jgi:hypothetical protein